MFVMGDAHHAGKISTSGRVVGVVDWAGSFPSLYNYNNNYWMLGDCTVYKDVDVGLL